MLGGRVIHDRPLNADVPCFICDLKTRLVEYPPALNVS